MDLNMKYFMEAPRSDRMEGFWSMHDSHVPVDTLFISGPRLKHKGYSLDPPSLPGMRENRPLRGAGLYDFIWSMRYESSSWRRSGTLFGCGRISMARLGQFPFYRRSPLVYLTVHIWKL